MSIAILPGRPVHASLSEYTHVALPKNLNALGNVLGGHIRPLNRAFIDRHGRVHRESIDDLACNSRVDVRRPEGG